MKCSSRQWQILDLLLNIQSEITAGDIAEQIGVSSRTVHRELIEIEQLIKPYGVSIQKRSGIGIQITGQPEQLQTLKDELTQSETQEFSSQDRRTLIISWLLDTDDPIKLFSLSHDLHVAIPTISSDLDELEGWLKKQNLILLRRRGYGVQIKGTEIAKRHAISLLAEEQLDDSELFTSSVEPPVHPVSRQLLSMVGKQIFFDVEKALWQLEERFPTNLTEAQYTKLLIKLSVAIRRIQQGKAIETHTLSPQAFSIKDEAAEKLDHFISLLQFDLPEAEILYFSHLFEAWEASDPLNLLELGDFQLADTVARMIRLVEQEVQIPLSKDFSLREGLLHHLEPAIKRIRDGGNIRNPLLYQIKKDYDILFQIVKNACQQTLSDLDVPDEEIAFIVMHFGASIERSNQVSQPIRALIVCTSGIGSSKLLAVRISKEFPQIDLIGHVSWFEAARVPKEDYNLILSTVDLPLPADQYIKISPLLTAEETERIRQSIQRGMLRTVISGSHSAEADATTLKQLKLFKEYLDEAIRLIQNFEVLPLSMSKHENNLKDILLNIGIIAKTKEWITHIDPIVEQIIEREQQSSQVIPDTRLALFHTRSDVVHHPFILLFRLEQPLILGNERPYEVHQILFMLGPKQLPKPSLEILSEISAMLLNTEMVRKLETANSENIQLFLAQELEYFIKTKMEW